MSALGRFYRWAVTLGAPTRLRRQARRAADPAAAAELFLRAVAIDDAPWGHFEAAAALARAGRLAEAAESWRRAVRQQPRLTPDAPLLAALMPVMPRIAPEVVEALVKGDGRRPRWKLERRGAFDGEERWRLEQDSIDEMAELLPFLRYLAAAVAQTAAAPGRLRIDCDYLDRTETGDELRQVGEAIFRWGEDRRPGEPTIQED